MARFILRNRSLYVMNVNIHKAFRFGTTRAPSLQSTNEMIRSFGNSVEFQEEPRCGWCSSLNGKHPRRYCPLEILELSMGGAIRKMNSHDRVVKVTAPVRRRCTPMKYQVMFFSFAKQALRERTPVGSCRVQTDTPFTQYRKKHRN